MLRKLLVLSALVTLCATNTAQAHLVASPKNDSLKARLHSQTVNLKHARYVCNNGKRDHKQWACKAKVWIAKERKATLLALKPPQPRLRYLSAWLCIHSGEGAWNANTGNGYYGGLQMDYGFQRTYGADYLKAKGTANNWTPYEQMVVAERAHRSGRGFYPWPSTARRCGLI